MKLKGDLYYMSRLVTNPDTQDQDSQDNNAPVHFPANAQQGIFNPAASAQHERLNF